MPRTPQPLARRASAASAGAALVVGTLVSLGALAGPADAAVARSVTPTCDGTTCTISFTTVGTDTFTVPTGVTSLSAVVDGAQGGSFIEGVPLGAGGHGGRTTATLPVTPASTLTVLVGGVGTSGTGGTSSGGAKASGGGGGSFVFGPDGSPLLAAGGGGGASAGLVGNAGGDGAGAGGTAQAGSGGATAGQPATASAGGAGGASGGAAAAAGSPGGGPTWSAFFMATPGDGGAGFFGGGAGGGGYYAGGGGGAVPLGGGLGAGGGGGGTGFAVPAATDVSGAGSVTGPGSVTLTYPDPTAIGTATASFALAADPAEPEVGDTVDLTLTASGTEGAPGGTIDVIAQEGDALVPLGCDDLALTPAASSSSAVCSTDDLPLGTSTILVDYSGDPRYAAANQVQAGTVRVSRQAQTITFPRPKPMKVRTKQTLEATSSAGLPVTYSTGSTKVCKVKGSTVKALRPGRCVVVAKAEGDATHANAAPVRRTIKVRQRP